MDPGRFLAIPIREDATAEEVRLGMAFRTPGQGLRIALVHPVIVVHEGHQIAVQKGDGGVQGMGFSGGGYGPPAQGQRALALDLPGVGLEPGLGVIGTGVGHHQTIQGPALGVVDPFQGFQGAGQESSPVVGTNEDGQAGGHGFANRPGRAWRGVEGGGVVPVAGEYTLSWPAGGHGNL